MRDEEYAFFTDCREKKSVAASAFKKRTHTGKGGRVRLPSDNLSKKELKKMSGECVTYRLNAPMKWDEFRAMPDEHKITYIKNIQKKWNVSLANIGVMLGISQSLISQETKRLGIPGEKRNRYTKWDKEGWEAWAFGKTKAEDDSGEKEEVPAVEEIAPACEVEEVKEEVCCSEERFCAVPDCGSMTYEGDINRILASVATLLNGKKVHIHIQWDVLED